MTTMPQLVDKTLVADPVGDAQRQGLVGGEDGLSARMTKLVLESALKGEMTTHLLGCDKLELGVEGSDNARIGTRAEAMLTKAGPVTIDVPATGRRRSSNRRLEAPRT